MGERLDRLMERARSLPELREHADGLPVAQKAEGARIYDVENHGYIDYTGGRGAAILGYANQFVLDAVRKTLSAGVPDGLHTPLEVELAESLERFVPWAASFSLFRSQDEALRAAVQGARQLTGRDVVLVVEGSGSPSLDDLVLSGGRSKGFVREVPAWDVDRIEAALAAGASKTAALVVDPLATRFGVIPPPEGLLPRLAEVCRHHGVLLVLDERVTGFRVARDGAAGWAGVEPDLAIYGGALGGGFPIGVLAWRDGLERSTGPAGHVFPTPHPASLAAAEAVLSILKNDAVYERLEERTSQLIGGLASLAERFGRPLVINAVGSVFSLYVSREPVTDRPSAQAADGDAYRRLASGLREEGVLLPLQGLQPLFLSHAHSQKDVEETLAAWERVLLKLHQEDLP